MQTSRAAASQKGEAARVVSLAQRNDPNAFGHLHIDQAVYAVGGFHSVLTQRSRHVLDNCSLGGVRGERQLATEKTTRLQVT